MKPIHFVYLGAERPPARDGYMRSMERIGNIIVYGEVSREDWSTPAIRTALKEEWCRFTQKARLGLCRKCGCIDNEVGGKICVGCGAPR